MSYDFDTDIDPDTDLVFTGYDDERFDEDFDEDGWLDAAYEDRFDIYDNDMGEY